MRLLTTAATLLLTLTSLTTAQRTANNLTILNDPSTGYTYHGCFNETDGRAFSVRERKLDLGFDMTPHKCFGFCRTNTGDERGGASAPFRFAGLKHATQCLCSPTLSSLSARLPDEACDMPCHGNETLACGGWEKLTVYILNSAGGVRPAWGAALLAAAGAAVSSALM